VTLNRRLFVVAALLAAAVGAQFLLQAHLGASPEGVYPELRQDLESFPLELRTADDPSARMVAVAAAFAVAAPDSALAPVAVAAAAAPVTPAWSGQTSPHIDKLREKLTFEVNGLVSRQYQLRRAGLAVGLYMVYSRSADDRKHHPEVCIRDAGGASEELAGRALVPLDESGDRFAQRLRFHTGIAETTTVYYWHYTLEPGAAPGLTTVQRFHQRLSQSAPSITVQVSATAPSGVLGAVEKDFLPLVDATMKEQFLPSRTRVGCDRLPIGVVRE
jgi:hypothetical protein